MTVDIYANPNAAPPSPPNGEQGSLAGAVQGAYQVAIAATLREAWLKTDGAKWTFQLALSVYILVYIVLAVVGNLLQAHFGLMPSAENMHFSFNMVGAVFLQQIVGLLITLPLSAGLFMLGVRRSVDAPIATDQIFNYYDRALPLLITTVLMYVMVFIGFCLFILPGIYLAVAYVFAIPLVVDKGLSPWQALETSRRAISQHWLAVFGFFLLFGLLNALTVFTLFIGMIWTIPLSIIANGILYRRMFGYAPGTLA